MANTTKKIDTKKVLQAEFVQFPVETLERVEAKLHGIAGDLLAHSHPKLTEMLHDIRTAIHNARREQIAEGK